MARSELDVVTFTDGARAHVVAFLAEEEEPLSVRIEVLDSSPLTPRYDLSLIEESEREPGDQVFEQEGFEVVVPMASVDLLRGATVDWVESMQGSGFRVVNPNIVPIGEVAAEGPLADRVKRVIELQVNPAIASHGGSVTLIYVQRMNGPSQWHMAISVYSMILVAPIHPTSTITECSILVLTMPADRQRHPVNNFQ